MRHLGWWVALLLIVVLAWWPARSAAQAPRARYAASSSRAEIVATAVAAARGGGQTPATATPRHAGNSSPATVTPPAAGVGDIPPACEGDNPYFAAAVPGRDDDIDPAGAAALVAFIDTPDDDPSSHVVLATHEQVGATYGLAYDWRRGHLYAGAFHRRGTGLGPGGPGQVYRAIVALETVEPWALISAGPDRHGGVDDASAATWVGRSGLGDLEMDDDGTQLFVVNLHERRIHRLSVPEGVPLGSFPHGAASEPWADRARPFGLGFHDGMLVHGVIDEGEPDAASALPRLHLYRSRPDGSEMVHLMAADLDYRTRPMWSAWSDEATGDQTSQPIFADIVFRANGEPVIGLRDRAADMAHGHASGDVLSTRRGAGWELVTEPEHYLDMWQRDESLWGALATMPGFDLIVASAGAPIRPESAGAVWYHNATGGEVTSETIAGGGVAGKVSRGGVGDIELMCGARGAPTLVPTPTPTPTPAPIYVPLALHETCPPLMLDVTLVIDLSTSMLAPTRGGRIKVEAALDASRAFIDLLQLTPDDPELGDRAAIVGFNARAWSEIGLTADTSLLSAGLDRLEEGIAQHTRLDLAMTQGASTALGEGHRVGAQAVVILLTDGRPSEVPPAEDGTVVTTVLRAASAAKDAGVRIYTVGVGPPEDVAAPLLEAMASEPTGYVYAPDAEMLTAVYERLATDVRCPSGRHDWSKPWP